MFYLFLFFYPADVIFQSMWTSCVGWMRVDGSSSPKSVLQLGSSQRDPSKPRHTRTQHNTPLFIQKKTPQPCQLLYGGVLDTARKKEGRREKGRERKRGRGRTGAGCAACSTQMLAATHVHSTPGKSVRSSRTTTASRTLLGTNRNTLFSF